MKKPRSVISSLLTTTIVLSLFTNGHAASGSSSDTGAQITSAPTATLRAASGASILFKTQDGPAVKGVSMQGWELPHLVLRRNGALTNPDERTLLIEVTGIEAPPPGVTVTLYVETQHSDPDLHDRAGAPSLPSIVRGSEGRIPVWRESRWIANTIGVTQTHATAVFTHTFRNTVISGTEMISMPTDYFRYDVAVIAASHPITNPLHAFGEDHAFLMENQWIARLPEVQEASDGAAPDELIVYYCDMFPFQKTAHDPATRLAREDVPDYVHTELVPQMVEAFRVQTDDWGFPWHQAWTSFRPEEEPERLSVALADGRTWFHDRAPSRGHAGISIQVEGGNARYDTLTDGTMSTVHHELFHNLQRNIDQNNGGNGDVDGEQGAWELFSEGTAMLASSVGQPLVQFTQTSGPRAYLSNANGFVGGGGRLGGDLNTSYERMSPYHAAIYWRFLYEQCGGIRDDVEDPAAGMEVIRNTLMALYSGDIVDIGSSTDLVAAVPEIMDRALEGSSCPFKTHEESLVAFARAIYGLRLGGGRCTPLGTPAGCGFYDPQGLYHDPPLSTVTYAGAEQHYAGEIGSSFGMDFVEVMLDPTADGQALTVEFHPAPGADAEFNVQLWKLIDPGGGARPQPVSTQQRRFASRHIKEVGPKILTPTNLDEGLSHVIPAIDTTAYNRLGLIITRTDASERLDPVGKYTIVLRPAAPKESLPSTVAQGYLVFSEDVAGPGLTWRFEQLKSKCLPPRAPR